MMEVIVGDSLPQDVIDCSSLDIDINIILMVICQKSLETL
jgi:hypothetical protein